MSPRLLQWAGLIVLAAGVGLWAPEVGLAILGAGLLVFGALEEAKD